MLVSLYNAVAPEAVVTCLMLFANLGDGVTTKAILIGLCHSVVFGVGPVRREWRHAGHAGTQDDYQAKGNAGREKFFHGCLCDGFENVF